MNDAERGLKIVSKTRKTVLEAFRKGKVEKEYDAWTACAVLLREGSNIEIEGNGSTIVFKGDGWRYEEDAAEYLS